MIDEVGMDGISQDAVAKRVGITQSALRHHFPTRESGCLMRASSIMPLAG